MSDKWASFALQECSFGPITYLVDVNIDRKAKRVVARAIFGADVQEAVYLDEHRGCSLVRHESTAPNEEHVSLPARAAVSNDNEWPSGNRAVLAPPKKLKGTFRPSMIQ